jgi:putative ABC transport system permease protein
MLEEKVANVVQGLWAVLALCSIVAAFGLVNTLTMNILEQTYEIGMLRTIAMARGQVRKMIFSQALLMGIIALLPAVFAGLLIAYLLSLSNGPTVGRPITFTLRPQLTAMAFVGEMLLILLASMIPAERAARLKITDTVRFQ